MKTFRVNLYRRIVVECSVVVKAKNRSDARQVATMKAEDGKLGEPLVSFREYGMRRDVEIDILDVREEIEVEDAYEED